jgi:hypothetical protein
MAVDKSGNVYVTGLLEDESLTDDSNLENTYIAKYDSSGELLWKQQLFTVSSNYFDGYDVTIKPSRNVQINGTKTVGPLPEPIAIVTSYTDWYGSRSSIQYSSYKSVDFSAEYDSRGNQIFYEEKDRNDYYSYDQGSDPNQGLYPKGLSQIQSLKEGVIPWSQSLGNSYNIDQNGIVYNVDGNNLFNWFPIESLL